MGKIVKRTSGHPTFPLQGKSIPGGATDFMLAHVTAVGRAREILSSGQILARHCKFLNIDLSYFFVLRPAYRRKDGAEPSDQLNRFPFVFVVSPENLGPPYHVYPFDTGGALDGQFDQQADDYVFLEDYRLLPNYGAVSGHINWAFGSRASYYDGELRLGLMETLAYHEAGPRSFLRIAALAAIGSNMPDQRASAIEVAFNHHISVKDNVKFAVMPRQFLEDPHGDNKPMLDALKAARIAWTFYEWEPNRTPDEFRQEINKLVRDYLVKEGQL